jgi:hypothetical protein
MLGSRSAFRRGIQIRRHPHPGYDPGEDDANKIKVLSDDAEAKNQSVTVARRSTRRLAMLNRTAVT